MTSVLQKIIQPDTDAVKQGTTELNAALQKSEGVSQLCQVLGDKAVKAELRQCAAAMLRRHLMPSKHWQRLTPDTKQALRDGLLNVLGSEADSSVRTALAMLVGLVARHEPWPVLLQRVHAMIAAEDLPQKQLALYLLSVLSSEAVQCLVPQLAHLLVQLDAALSDSRLLPPSVGHAIATLARLAEVVGEEHASAMQAVVRKVVTVSQGLLPQDEQPVWEAIELLEVLVESEVPVLANDLPATVQFCIALGSNAQLGDGLRIKAITFLGLVTRYKKKYLLKHKLGSPLVLALFEVLCEEASDDNPLGILMADSPDNAAGSSGDDEVMQTAAQALDTCARHLPPDRLLQPLMPAVEAALQSEDRNRVKGGYLALAMITDGCSERLRTKHIEVLLQCVCRGVTSDQQVVRDSALLALAQFADYLQPDISRYHQQVLPIIFTYLTQVCESSKNGTSDPPGASRIFYAVEVFCENMEQEDLLPHLQELLHHVLAILQVEQTSQYMKKNAISVIGAVALSVKEHMAPYFEQIVALLKTHLLVETNSDSSRLQLQSLETLAQLTRSLGGQHIEKYAGDITQLAQSLLSSAVKQDDPDLKKTCYRLFAALASVMQDRLAPELPGVIDSMVTSLQSSEGVVPVLKDEANKAILQSLGEIEYTDSENEGDEDDEDEEDDLDVAGYSVENAFLEEKEDTCVALRELAESCGEGFIPFISRVAADVFKLVNYPNEDVRQAALVTMTQFVIALAKSTSPQAEEGFEHWVRVMVAKMSELVRTDEYSVVTAGLEGYADLLTGAGSRVLRYEGHLAAMLACVTDVFNKKTKCQRDDAGDDDEDDSSLDEAEMDEMLVESAGDIIVPLGKALGPAQFAQHFPSVLALLGRRLRPNSTECVRSYVVGNLAECVDVLGTECVPFLVSLLPVFMQWARDPSSGEVRGNAIYGLGLLGLHGGEAVVPSLPGMLMGLSEIMAIEKEPRPADNICGALARIVGAHANAVPVATILPALLNYLPLREDFEENMTVFSTFSALYQQREPTVLQHLHVVLRGAAFVYTTSQADPACQAVIEDLVRRIKVDSPDQLNSILQTFPEPELRARIEKAASSSPPAPEGVAAASGGPATK